MDGTTLRVGKVSTDVLWERASLEVTLIYSRPSDLSSKKQKNEKYRRGKRKIYFYFPSLIFLFYLAKRAKRKKKIKIKIKNKIKKSRRRKKVCFLLFYFFVFAFFLFFLLFLLFALFSELTYKTNKWEFHVLFYGERGKKKQRWKYFFLFLILFFFPLCQQLLFLRLAFLKVDGWYHTACGKGTHWYH